MSPTHGRDARATLRLATATPRRGLAVAVLALMLASGGLLSAEAPVDVHARARALRRGVNLSHWYAQSLTGGYDEARLASYMTEADMHLIAAMGFDHVRLTLDPRALFEWKDAPSKAPGDPQKPDEKAVGKAAGQLPSLNHDAIARFESRLAALLDRKLSVVVDFHPGDDFKKRLHTLEGEAAFLEMWSALAASSQKWPLGRVFLEILNEPGETWPTAEWAPLQARVLAAIRRAAPRHTVIATAGKWSGVKELEAFSPLDDPNVIYTFHHYEPMLFTHQSSPWTWHVCKNVAGVGFPIAPADVEQAVAAAAKDEEAAKFLRWEITKGMHTAEWQRERLGLVAAWQAKHGGVPIYAGEFGAYVKSTPPEARARWLETCRKEFERHGWGWAVWDYKGEFRIVCPGVVRPKREGEVGTPSPWGNTIASDGTLLYPDKSVMEALGLAARKMLIAPGPERIPPAPSAPSPH